MKRLLLLTLIPGVLVLADEQSKRAKIDEMMKLTKVEEMSRQQIVQMRSMMQEQARRGPDPENAKIVADKIVDLMDKRLSWERMKTGLVKIYDDMFSEQELDGIINFYKTPAGQDMLTKMPQLMQRGMQLGAEMMGDVQGEIKKIVEESKTRN